MRKLIPAILLSVALSSAAHGQVITADRGGIIGDYINRYGTIAASGEQVAIDGTCASACTLALRFVPRSQLCITSRAELGFHSAFDPKDHSFSAGGTALLWQSYPERVRRLLLARGWNGHTAHPDVIWLKAKALRGVVRACS